MASTAHRHHDTFHNSPGRSRRLLVPTSTCIFLMCLGSGLLEAFNLMRFLTKQTTFFRGHNNCDDGGDYTAPFHLPPNIQNLSQLSYGIELSYILPFEVLAQIPTSNQSHYASDAKYSESKKVMERLREVGVQTGMHGHRTSINGSWTITPERGGPECASYIDVPPSEIQTMMRVFNESRFIIDPDLTAFHINIDATNRSMEHVKNVYKNYIAVEEAIESFRSSTYSNIPGDAVSLKKRFGPGVKQAYEELEKPRHFPYPQFNYQTKADGSIEKRRSVARSVLSLKMNSDTNKTRNFEFRGIQGTHNFEVVWAWIQFARQFVAASYAGVVLEPKERTLEEQWDVLFNTLIQDKHIETVLNQWQYGMHIPSPQREEILHNLCPMMPQGICRHAMKALIKRKKRERKVTDGIWNITDKEEKEKKIRRIHIDTETPKTRFFVNRDYAYDKQNDIESSK